MNELKNLRVAVLATDGFEESELTVPMASLQNEGATVEILSLKEGKIQAFKHHDKSIQVAVKHKISDVKASDFDALVLPGGALNADQLRADKKALQFVREMQEAGKPIASICHAPWILISAGLVKGRNITSYFSIQDDLKNAGANWEDKEVITDSNWVSSRAPNDLPAFCREMISLFSRATPSIIQIAESA